MEKKLETGAVVGPLQSYFPNTMIPEKELHSVFVRGVRGSTNNPYVENTWQFIIYRAGNEFKRLNPMVRM